MRTVHWLFIVSVALFIGGIAFIVAAERTSQRIAQAPASAPPVTTRQVASARQLMTGIIGPAAKAVFASVGTIVTDAGTEERQPRTDEEWEAVASSAAALSEGGNLLLMGRRATDKDWIKIAQDLVAAGEVALQAAQAKDADGLLRSGEAINASCDNCHQQYVRE